MDHRAILREGDQRGVEGGVVMGGEEQAVEDVEALGVAVANRPGFDVAGAEEGAVLDAGDGAGAAPIAVESVTENILADALDDEPLGLGAFW